MEWLSIAGGGVFQRFTDRARRVVVLAQEEARMLNHNYIGTEHVLIALILEGEGVAAKALDSSGITVEDVRQQVVVGIGRGEQRPSGHIPFTPRSKSVLELSLREALQLGHNYIGTEHILLGLIREGKGVATQVLVRLGVNLERVRQQVLQLQGVDASPLSSDSTAIERPESCGGIFLSYRREDSSHVAGRIADKLADKFGEDRVFVDVDSIDIGADFRDAISGALNRCRVLLAVIGRDWLTAVDDDGSRRIELEDDLVRIEIQTALDRRIRVVPILVDGAGNLKERDLPAALRDLAYRNAISLRHETFREDLKKLLAGLEKIVPVAGRSGKLDNE